VQRDDLNDEMRVAAIRGIGRDYATSQDAEFLRGLYAKLPSEKTKDAGAVVARRDGWVGEREMAHVDCQQQR
jgi:hypothetical protein